VYPNVLRIDPISVDDFCGGCGRAHARCKSYTHVTFSGMRYDKRTLVSASIPRTVGIVIVPYEYGRLVAPNLGKGWNAAHSRSDRGTGNQSGKSGVSRWVHIQSSCTRTARDWTVRVLYTVLYESLTTQGPTASNQHSSRIDCIISVGPQHLISA
jgi:hypothetical protein